ncbi:MAG: type II toxin-antitoxin system PemK/MazF family toxin [Candidatus Tumulicola sp.]
MASTSVRRGDLWWVTLDPAVGSETKKKRPCVVVQRDAANAVSPTTIVCPLTHAKRHDRGIVNVTVFQGYSGLKKTSTVVCNQVRVVDLTRFGERIGRIDAEALGSVERGLRAILDL